VWIRKYVPINRIYIYARVWIQEVCVYVSCKHTCACWRADRRSIYLCIVHIYILACGYRKYVSTYRANTHVHAGVWIEEVYTYVSYIYIYWRVDTGSMHLYIVHTYIQTYIHTCWRENAWSMYPCIVYTYMLAHGYRKYVPMYRIYVHAGPWIQEVCTYISYIHTCWRVDTGSM
jgi:hypothetical protein